jgi:hypothetical protein
MMGLSAIILSYTNSEKIHRMTLECIDSLIVSEDFNEYLQLEILLIESNQNYREEGFAYPENVKVIVPGSPFNFHAYLNIGIKASAMPFVALCNNDLLFRKHWFTEILNVKKNVPRIRSFSPVQSGEATGEGLYSLGYDVRKHLKGWCMVAERKLFDNIGLPDEQFDFYYADDDYAMTLRKYHEPHALVHRSVVEHLGGENTGSSREEGNEAFKSIINKYPDLPKYLFSDGYKWILKNEKLLDGHLKFHRKWGSIRSISIKNKLAKILSPLGLGRLVSW